MESNNNNKNNGNNPDETTPLNRTSSSGSLPPSHAYYFLQHAIVEPGKQQQQNNNRTIEKNDEEIESMPEGSTTEEFASRPVFQSGRLNQSYSSSSSSWLSSIIQTWFQPKKKQSRNIATGRAGAIKVEPKVFFANERTFLAWLHTSVLLAGASVAILSFTDDDNNELAQFYGLLLLPIAIVFITYAIFQYSRRSRLIRRRAPGPYEDVIGPTMLGVLLMLSITAQFSIQLYSKWE